MEYFGFLAFVIILVYSSYPARVQILEKRINKLKRNLEGDQVMSKIIRDLVGKHCIMSCEGALAFAGKVNFECEIIDVDEEWIKISFTDQKKKLTTKSIRIERIDHIDLI